jgi:hypothetical protein
MLILFCMRGCGRIERPAFPAPSDDEGGTLKGKTRAKRRGENAKLWLQTMLLFENNSMGVRSATLVERG